MVSLEPQAMALSSAWSFVGNYTLAESPLVKSHDKLLTMCEWLFTAGPSLTLHLANSQVVAFTRWLKR